MWFWRRPRRDAPQPEDTSEKADTDQPVWPGVVPAGTAEQAVQQLTTARDQTAQLDPTDPVAPGAAAYAAASAADALRAVLLLSGRTTYEAMHRDDRTYVAYDMIRRLQLLAESVAEPRSWEGVTTRARWAGQVAEWSGFDIGPAPDRGYAALVPLIEELHRLRPLPGADPAEPALRLVEPVLVGVVQHALRWAVPAATGLLDPAAAAGPTDSVRSLDRHRVVWTRLLTRMRRQDPRLMRYYDQLVEVEHDLAAEMWPSRRWSGGHMDVRPDEVVVHGLEWRAAASVGVVVLLGQVHLTGGDAQGRSMARDAYEVVEAVATGISWADESVAALRMLVDLALVLTVSEQERAFLPPGPLG